MKMPMGGGSIRTFLLEAVVVGAMGAMVRPGMDSMLGTTRGCAP